MGKGQKVAVTIILVIVFIFGGGLLMVAGSSKTFVGLLALGLYYGVKAMFNSKEENETEANVLDKGGPVDPTPE